MAVLRVLTVQKVLGVMVLRSFRAAVPAVASALLISSKSRLNRRQSL